MDGIVQRFRQRGDTKTDAKNSGRKKITTQRQDRAIIRLSKANVRSTSKDIADALAIEYGVQLDSSTVRRRLSDANRPAIRPIAAPVLTPRMRAARLNWCRAHQHWSVDQWKKVIFSDETHIEVQPFSSRFVRHTIGEAYQPDHFSTKFRHPVKVMIWGCMSWQGTGRIHVVNGMMEKNQYLEVLRSRVD